MEGWLNSDKLERMWKEAGVVYLGTIPVTFQGDWRQPRKTLQVYVHVLPIWSSLIWYKYIRIPAQEVYLVSQPPTYVLTLTLLGVSVKPQHSNVLRAGRPRNGEFEFRQE